MAKDMGIPIWTDQLARKIYNAFPEGKMKAFTLSYDDGVTSDVKLVEMMRKYGVKGTFNLNSGLMPEKSEMGQEPWGHLTMEECVELYGDDMEVAVHGKLHPFWNKLPTAQAMMDILDDRRELERAFGRIVRGAAYPYGATNDAVVEILRLADFQYCRTGKGGKMGMKNEPDWLRLQCTCSHKDPKLMEYAENFLKPVSGGIRQMFYVAGHSYEFVLQDNWHIMEELLQKVSGKDDVWYATNMEIYNAWSDYMRLETSADGRMIHNPSARSVWVAQKNKAPFEIQPGQTVCL